MKIYEWKKLKECQHGIEYAFEGSTIYLKNRKARKEIEMSCIDLTNLKEAYDETAKKI